MPFVRFILPLILGIIAAVFLGIQEDFAIVCIGLGFFGVLLTELTRNIKHRLSLEQWLILPLSILLFGLGAFLVHFNSTIEKEDHFSKYPNSAYLKGRVTETPQSKKKSMKVLMSVEAVKSGHAWQPVEGELLLYLQKDITSRRLEIGDELLIPANYNEVTPPSNPGEFDYKRFLSFRDIYHQQYLAQYQWTKVSTKWSLRKQSERWRAGLRRSIARIGMGEEEEAIASALLLGKKDELGPELTRSYASAGAMHVLAVSGLHVGIIYFILQFMLRWMKKLPRGKVIRALTLILCLWIYAFITGLSPSVVRASTMFTAVSIATGLDRRSNIYNTVASSAFLLLIINPLYIMEVGFQLSYLAVLGIIYLHPKIYSLLYFPKKIPDKLWAISAVSISAQLATFPLGLLYFHQFPSYFLLSNLVVIPMAFLILYIGLFYLAFAWLPVVGAALGKLLFWSIAFLNGSVAWVESLPASLIQGIDISIMETWLIYLFLGLTGRALIHRNKKAVFASLTVLAGLLIMQIYEVFDYKKHQYLVVYDVRGDSVINLLSDSENLVYADAKWKDDLDKQQFHLKNNWNKHGAPEPVFLVDNTHNAIKTFGSGLMIYKDKSMMHIDDTQDLDLLGMPIHVDFLILSYHKGLSMERIANWVQAEQIILDSSIRGRTIERLCEEAAGETIHVVAEDGYFSQRL
jgi:competence protein ComEC